MILFHSGQYVIHAWFYFIQAYMSFMPDSVSFRPIRQREGVQNIGPRLRWLRWYQELEWYVPLYSVTYIIYCIPSAVYMGSRFYLPIMLTPRPYDPIYGARFCQPGQVQRGRQVRRAKPVRGQPSHTVRPAHPWPESRSILLCFKCINILT